MSKKVKMLEVQYFKDDFYFAWNIIRTALIRPEEFEDFKRNVHSILKIKRIKIKM